MLLLVFVPLDAVFYQGELKRATLVGLAVLALVGFLLIVAGILLERETE